MGGEKGLCAPKLRFLLDYDAETGVFRWKNPTSPRLHKGELAGSVRPDGRRRIRIGYKGYLASRLAWLYVYGEWPSSIIDHIDRDRSNDAIANLRPADVNQSLANRGARESSQLGLRNIVKHKRRYVVRFFKNKRATYRESFVCLDEAIAARNAQLAAIYGAFSPSSPDRSS